MLSFEMIDCVNYAYISIKPSRSGYRMNLSGYLFDGKEPEPTKKQYWYKIEAAPKKVTVKKAPDRTNLRYELKAGYVPSDLMPSVIELGKWLSDEYESVSGLYDCKYDTVDAGYEEVEFEISTIHKKEDFEFVPKIYNTQVSLITQLEYPEEIWQEKPCKVSATDMFDIIRKHVKANIDTKVATITSDYDFHFAVAKQIDLADSYSVQVDTNNSFLNKRRKPKWVSKTISNKKEEILNLKSKASGNDYGKDCVLPPEIIGENQLDLNIKIAMYLEELMRMINTRYCECPNCKGWGLVEVEE